MININDNPKDFNSWKSAIVRIFQILRFLNKKPELEIAEILDGVVTIDLNTEDYFYITLPEDPGPYTINFTDLSVGTNIIYIKQNSLANGVVTFTNVEWPGGVAPVITTTASKIDIVTLVSDGTTLRGVITQDYN